jgi:hypothetical protein
MDDEQRVAQRLQVLRDLGFVEFIGQRRIKEVQPPDSPEVPFEDPNAVSRKVAEPGMTTRMPWLANRHQSTVFV